LGSCSRRNLKKDAIFPADSGKNGIFNRKVGRGRVSGGAGSGRGAAAVAGEEIRSRRFGMGMGGLALGFV
jgi:hypothetical protein